MPEELQAMIAFVEGKISPAEFERRLAANPSGFEQILSHDPDLPTEGYLDQSVFEFIRQKDYSRFADVLHAHRVLNDYLFRKAIPSSSVDPYAKLLRRAQPSWLSVINSDYFWNEILPLAGDRAGDDLRLWIYAQLLERFQYVKKPPKWLQGEDWPIRENGPLVFLGEFTVDEYFLDDAKVFVFYDPDKAECETILQVA